MIYFYILLLLIAILPLPYGYYILLRFIVSFGLLREIFVSSKNDIDTNFILTAIVILYNPIFPFPLGRTIWTFVNIFTIVYLIYYSLKSKK